MFHEDGVQVRGGGLDYCFFVDDRKSSVRLVGLVLVYDFVSIRDGCGDVCVGGWL